MTSKIRLYVKHNLGTGQTVSLNRKQAHYLFTVMRRKPHDEILIFNGRDGEWKAEILNTKKNTEELTCVKKIRSAKLLPDLWLLFAPIKRNRTEFIVEKATELGASRIIPVKTEFTNLASIRLERLVVYAIEAVEQCGGISVPEITQIQALNKILTQWPSNRHLMFCDEKEVPKRANFSTMQRGPWAILIGPEGGFSNAERAQIKSLLHSYPFSLGPRILRADTAAVAAIALWQQALGEWE
ncbi:MAG: 16S rRNA (uracil(1498)-N(3))-methyltransferase [Aestuariivita sp.]|nr:16S rRNA (uracil(1498)-N(3))-methyltransferase [Aestuariivita sp.]